MVNEYDMWGRIIVVHVAATLAKKICTDGENVSFSEFLLEVKGIDLVY